MSTRLDRSDALMRSRQCSSVVAIGFSRRTCLPASRKNLAAGWCRTVGQGDQHAVHVVENCLVVGSGAAGVELVRPRLPRAAGSMSTADRHAHPVLKLIEALSACREPMPPQPMSPRRSLVIEIPLAAAETVGAGRSARGRCGGGGASVAVPGIAECVGPSRVRGRGGLGREMWRVRARKSFFQKTLELRRGGFLADSGTRPSHASDDGWMGVWHGWARSCRDDVGEGWAGGWGVRSGAARGGWGDRTGLRAGAGRRGLGGGEGGAISRQPAPRGGGLARDSLGRIFRRVGDEGWGCEGGSGISVRQAQGGLVWRALSRAGGGRWGNEWGDRLEEWGRASGGRVAVTSGIVYTTGARTASQMPVRSRRGGRVSGLLAVGKAEFVAIRYEHPGWDATG